MTDKNKEPKKSNLNIGHELVEIGKTPVNLKNENDTIEFLLSSIPESAKSSAGQSFEYLKHISRIQNNQIERQKQLKERADKFNDALEGADFDSDMGVLEFRDNIKNIYPYAPEKYMGREFARDAAKKPDDLDGLDELVDILKILTRQDIERNIREHASANSNKVWSLQNIYRLCDMYYSLVNWIEPINVVNYGRPGVVNQAVNALSEVMMTGKYDSERGYGTMRQLVENIKHEEMEIKRKEKADEISQMVEGLSSEQIQEAIELIRNKKNKDNLKKPGM